MREHAEGQPLTMTAKQIADTLGALKRTIAIRANREGWPWVRQDGNGGTAKGFLVHALPEDIRRELGIEEAPTQQESNDTPDDVGLNSSIRHLATQIEILNALLSAFAITAHETIGKRDEAFPDGSVGAAQQP